jgi:hypothetical protein
LKGTLLYTDIFSKEKITSIHGLQVAINVAGRDTGRESHALKKYSEEFEQIVGIHAIIKLRASETLQASEGKNSGCAI